ncbi:hypothetical protein SOVF_007060 [Spinacia oleracea]|uniref:Protein PELPK2-like n=1 Tax=Spinacia oleracea TaxID=3562 RepID=A0A9R0JYL0_SPIOL|nr:protein PELPK2-like [Spinacia oleracea]KNA25380.1 hypothetical protein SOVF_007060 [Spinacia oleracea]
MAYTAHQFFSIVIPALLLITLLSPINNIKIHADARLLAEEVSDLPLPQPELPAFTGVELPPLPDLSSLHLPAIPSLPEFFRNLNLPQLSNPTFTAFPGTPQEIPTPSFNGAQSTTNP